MKTFSFLAVMFVAISTPSLSGLADEPKYPQPINLDRLFKSEKPPVEVLAMVDGKDHGLQSLSTAIDTRTSVQSFPAGNLPEGLASDGNSIWVVDEFDNAVTKLRRSDGVIEGVFAVGREPKYLVFDGVNIWASNYGDGRVTKLRASDGKLQGTFTLEPARLGSPSTAPISGSAIRLVISSPNYEPVTVPFRAASRLAFFRA